MTGCLRDEVEGWAHRYRRGRRLMGIIWAFEIPRIDLEMARQTRHTARTD